MIVEALQRPDLLSQALDEVVASQSWSSLSSDSSINIDSLCGMPILQSMYAETLRLYTSLFALRTAAHNDFNLGDFTIPKDEMLGIDTRVAAMDRSIWNVGDTTIELISFGLKGSWCILMILKAGLFVSILLKPKGPF